MSAVTACLIIIGNEILSGRTKDANLSWLAERLTETGIRLSEVRVIPDVEAEIIATVNACRTRYTYVFTTGGIGPTHDDITAESIARAFGVPLERHPEAVRRLEMHYNPGQLNEARLRMANVPQGGILIDNPISSAPGFQIENVFVMAGVPAIMQAMFDGLCSRLTGGPVLLSRTVSCLLSEGQIAADLTAIQNAYPDVEVGSYPYFRNRQFGVSLVLRSTDAARLEAASSAVADMVRRMGDTPAVTVGMGG